MALNIGRRGKIFLMKEAAYGTEEALVASNFMRHIEANFAYDPFARVTSPERKQSPGPVNRFDVHLEPSGVAGRERYPLRIARNPDLRLDDDGFIRECERLLARIERRDPEVAPRNDPALGDEHHVLAVR